MSIFQIAIYAVSGIYLLFNLKHDIHMLQQNSYRIPRYWRYLMNGDTASPWRLTDVALLFLLFSTLLDIRLAFLLIGATFITKIFLILNKKFKKPLVFTKRVYRIYSVASVLTLGVSVAGVLFIGTKPIGWGYYSGAQVAMGIILLLAIFSWATVIAAVFILKPVEAAINRRYWNEASNILKSMPDLTVIGITGSYGKTSTKHYLERILSEQFEVLMTPGSFNTPMGVIRTIREMMKPYDRIFICEMGAKQKGDIKEICDLVHPQIGIITAVGPMHLETFKSIENVQSTKFELADALPADGLAVINDDFEYCANRNVSNVKAFRYCVAKDGKTGKDYTASNIEYTPSGTNFTIKDTSGHEYCFSTKLVGECNISNLTAAVIVALHLGMKPETISRAVSRIEQVEHRLSIKRTPGGITIIDDAFNSNPTGSKMALEVLGSFNNGKRIVVTPGMIELGDGQYELNKDLGRVIALNADVAVVVGHYNREAIVDGIKAAGFDEKNLYIVETFAESQKLLSTMMSTGDTVLYENDLPDSFK